MESQNNLNEHIRLITLKIQEEHPELIKYLTEIPRNLLSTSDKEIDNKALKDYLESLNNLLKTYAKKH